MRLQDKVAIVTGGGGGMGGGICACLAREGAHLIVSDLNLDSAQKRVEEIRQSGRRGRLRAYAGKFDCWCPK